MSWVRRGYNKLIGRNSPEFQAEVDEDQENLSNFVDPEFQAEVDEDQENLSNFWETLPPVHTYSDPSDHTYRYLYDDPQPLPTEYIPDPVVLDELSEEDKQVIIHKDYLVNLKDKVVNYYHECELGDFCGNLRRYGFDNSLNEIEEYYDECNINNHYCNRLREYGFDTVEDEIDSNIKATENLLRSNSPMKSKTRVKSPMKSKSKTRVKSPMKSKTRMKSK